MRHESVLIATLLAFGVSGLASDPVLLAARRFTATWLAGMPDIVCHQSTETFSAGPSHAWHILGTVLHEVTVEQGGVERYRLAGVPHRPDGGPDIAAAAALKSRGEFISAIRSLFDPKSKAVFRPRGTQTIEEQLLHRFDFNIRRENSQWFVGHNSDYTPPYFGTVWIDPDGRVRRLDMEANSFPSDSIVLRVRMKLTLSPVYIGGARYLMPATAEVIACTRQAVCERRSIRFTQYQRFTANSRVLP